MKNVWRLCLIALIGLSAKCQDTPQPPVPESPNQVIFASDIFLLDLEQKEQLLINQQDSQLVSLRKLAATPKTSALLTEKLLEFQKANKNALEQIKAQRNFAIAQEFGIRAGYGAYLKPPKVPPPPPPPCGSGGSCRIAFDRRKVCEIYAAVTINQHVKITIRDVNGKAVDVPVKQVGLTTNVQRFIFDLGKIENLTGGTLDFAALDTHASIQFDIVQ